MLCLQCEYDLRGLPRDGRCPECGSEIELSWQRHEAQLACGRGPLALSSPHWLRRMAVGCTLLVVAGAGVIGTMVMWVLRSPSDAEWQAVSLGLALMTTAGMWMLVSREPAASAANATAAPLWPDRATRYIARVAIALNLAVTLWYCIIQSGLRFFGDLSALQRQSLAGVVLDAMITWLIWRHLARLARRTPHAHLASCAEVLAWLLPPTMILQVAVFFMIPLRAEAWFGTPAPVTGALIALALLPFSLAYELVFDGTIVMWSIGAALALVALGVLARLSVLFASLARGGQNQTSPA